MVDVIDHGCKASAQRTIETRSEQTIDDDIMIRQQRGFEIGNDLYKFHPFHAQQPPLVLVTIRREVIGRVEQVGLHMVGLFMQQAGDGQRIGTIVALTGKNNHPQRTGIVATELVHKGTGCPFHKIDRTDRLMLDRIFVKILDFISCKYLHHIYYVLQNFLR